MCILQLVRRNLKLMYPWPILHSLASVSLSCPLADAIASNLTTFATATNNVALGEAASIIAQACSNVAVPRPPISFDPISTCVNTAMLTLNATTFGASA